jgi:hypothetical protein
LEKVLREFIAARCGIRLGRSARTRSLHRRGFVYERPTTRLRKAGEAKRAALGRKMRRCGRRRRRAGPRSSSWTRRTARGAPGAAGDLHGKWGREGQPALVDSSCPRWGATADMELPGTGSSAISAAFLKQLRGFCWVGR